MEAFSYSVSHDLRAPLRAVQGFAEALLEDYGPELDANAQSFLREIERGGARMAQLIDTCSPTAAKAEARRICGPSPSPALSHPRGSNSTAHASSRPFFITKGEKGTGPGLWVSYGSLLRHGGTIYVRSQQSPDKHGTVFSILLPCQPDFRS